jgi:hypothetical protein
MYQGREQQNHVPSFVHDRTVAERAANLAWQFMLGGLFRRIVPFEVVVAVGEVDIFLVKDRCPLKRCSCEDWSQRASA